MEGEAIFKVLLVATLLQASYALHYTIFTAYTDAGCTVATGGVTILTSSTTCDATSSCTLVNGLYLKDTCATEDPIASGLPSGVAAWYTYTTTDRSCSTAAAPYFAVRYGPSNACFFDESQVIISFGECLTSQQKYNSWSDFAACTDGSSPNLSGSLADGDCLSTTGFDQKGFCPVVAQPVAPMSAPVDQPPMSAPMTAAPVAQQPVATPVKTPVQSPVAKKSGAMTNSVAMITLGMIVLFV